MIELYRPTNLKTFEKYAMKETHGRKIGLWFKDVNRNSLGEISEMLGNMEEAEVYVALLEEFLGYNLTRVVKIRDIEKDWNHALNLTFPVREVEEISAQFPTFCVDMKHRSVFVLVPKTPKNIAFLARYSKKRHIETPEYYGDVFDKEIAGMDKDVGSNKR